jgi:AraC family transcriptional regulator of adaptative response / DNA-3-methyladenine glycosylase II
LLRAHLPHWEELVHVVQRAARIPRRAGGWDRFETVLKTLIGKEAVVALVARHGTEVPGLSDLDLTHTFPSPETLAEADLGGLGLTPEQAETIRSFAHAVAEDDVRLDGSASADSLLASLTAIDGLDLRTAQAIAS